MNSKHSIFLILIVIVLIFASCTSYETVVKPVVKTKQVPKYKTEIRVEYKPINNPSINKRSKIGILKFVDFTDNKNAEQLASGFYNELLKDKRVLEKYTIYPYDVILSTLQKQNINYYDEEELKQLQDYLGIEYVIYGEGNFNRDSFFDLIIRKTSDVSFVNTIRFKNSKNSSALSDAIKFFAEDVIPEYTEVKVFDKYDIEEYTSYEYVQEKKINWVSIFIISVAVSVLWSIFG